MSFDEMLKNYKTKTCILSIERLNDSRYGNIRIVAGNQEHCDDVLHITGHSFEPGCPYEMCFPKNMNFEDFCYRCAILGEPMHSYVNLYQMGLWLNMFMIPLHSSEENIGYCIYSYDVTTQANSAKMTDVSAESKDKVLETCIKLRSSTDFIKTLNEIIGDLREICEASHCCIMLLDKEEKCCHTLAESFHPGSDLLPMDNYLDDDFYKMACNWENTLHGSTCIIIKDEKDMDELKEQDPVWQASLVGARVQSIVLFPLKKNEQLFGYIWANNFNVDNTVKIKETLELTTFFLGSEIENYLLMERLRVLSSVDMLTGIKNRNIMNNRIDRIIAGKDKLREPFAILFADLNGLKRVNDKKGHSVGDAMIREAALLLEEAFPDAEVYRAGGDEFMVIACGMTGEEVDKRIARLLEKAEHTENVSYAIGVALSENEPDILKAMRAADQRMYADKKAFYEKHPDLLYRG